MESKEGWRQKARIEVGEGRIKMEGWRGGDERKEKVRWKDGGGGEVVCGTAYMLGHPRRVLCP